VSAERDLRLLVATSTRVLAVAGLFDMHGHISVRDKDTIYICERNASRIAMRPEQIALVRLSDGARLTDLEPPSETALHRAAYRARQDVGSVAHFHPRAATAFAVVGRPLIVASNAGAYFGATIPVHDNPELIRNDTLGAAVARDLGTAKAVLLRGHGALVVGEDVLEVVTGAIFLEESAQRLAFAAQLGTPKEFTADEIVRSRDIVGTRSVMQKTWNDAIERARIAGALADLD
jgi:ribulose-5-phosphate 4-epimerase/fuculose-1-phosphate aldolase